MFWQTWFVPLILFELVDKKKPIIFLPFLHSHFFSFILFVYSLTFSSLVLSVHASDPRSCLDCLPQLAWGLLSLLPLEICYRKMLLLFPFNLVIISWIFTRCTAALPSDRYWDFPYIYHIDDWLLVGKAVTAALTAVQFATWLSRHPLQSHSLTSSVPKGHWSYSEWAFKTGFTVTLPSSHVERPSASMPPVQIARPIHCLHNDCSSLDW